MSESMKKNETVNVLSHVMTAQYQLVPSAY